MPDFLDEKRREIAARLNELGPLVAEYDRLSAAASALDGITGTPVAAAPLRRGPGRPPGSAREAATAVNGTTTAAPTKRRRRRPGRKKVGRPPASASKATAAATVPVNGRRRRGRRKGSGERSVQALAFVQAQPGITIPELAAKMGIQKNYLYRVLPALEQEKKISKQGRGWHPK